MIAYSDSAAEVVPDDLAGFFVGWPSPPTLDRRQELLWRSDAVSLAYDDGSLVGFATAISDGVLAPYIPFLEVLRSHQRRGIGTALIERLLAQLDDLYMVDVACDAPLEPFYAQRSPNCRGPLVATTGVLLSALRQGANGSLYVACRSCA